MWTSVRHDSDLAWDYKGGLDLCNSLPCDLVIVIRTDRSLSLARPVNASLSCSRSWTSNN